MKTRLQKTVGVYERPRQSSTARIFAIVTIAIVLVAAIVALVLSSAAFD
ncbi:MAG: hypothetical protein ACJ8G2_01150 [Burkholderiales bacterium]